MTTATATATAATDAPALNRDSFNHHTLANLRDRLRDEFVSFIDTDIIDRVVEDAYINHAHARVTWFVPLFVEREARRALSSLVFSATEPH